MASNEADRPTPDAEITPEMLDAGLMEFGKADLRFEEPAEIVARIYRAMVTHR